jgi:hypothetical protein
MERAGKSPEKCRRRLTAMPDTEELQNLLTAMAESEPALGAVEQNEPGTIAWYLASQ